MDDQIQIRALRTLSEMAPAVELQKAYWGDDGEMLVPAHMLFTIATCGGHVLAAMDGDRMVGVLIGLLGTDIEADDRPAMANLMIASKRMVVLPEYRSQGIGYRLKIAQREAAIKQGIRLVTWTFDPLLAKNAHLNLHKLGCISQQYLVDYYGNDPHNSLVTLGTSDRLAVEWWITNRRVEARLNTKRADLTLMQYLDGNATIVNHTQPLAAFIQPTDSFIEPMSAFALLEIPTNYPDMVVQAPELAITWRDYSRQAFLYLMQKGYLIVDFVRGTLDGQEHGYYVLGLNSGFEFRLN
ncbi:MAG: hypothetical protein OHK0046_05410 [Anaerolineae bacterium]